jgi:hypothetical protein
MNLMTFEVFMAVSIMTMVICDETLRSLIGTIFMVEKSHPRRL